MKNKNIRIVGDDGKEMPIEPRKHRSVSFGLVAMISSLVLGLFGGVLGTLLVLAAPSSIQEKLGIDKLQAAVDNSVTTEKVVVEEDSATIDVVEKVSPAVVSIMYTKDVSVYNPFTYFGTSSEGTIQEQGGGSGFIITSDGLIVTNKHVVSDTEAKYTVYTYDKKTYDATVVALDPTMDLAIIKIEATGLPVVELGSSEKLQVGQKVIAIGNALAEFENTVTEGVLSAIGRSITASDLSGSSSSEELSGLLQTDAAINSGNSGGPLVNLGGQVIGMNTATADKSSTEGIGFAIPIDDLKSAIESVKETGKIVRPLLGVNTIELTEDIAKKMNLNVSEGFMIIGDASRGISAVIADSPADKAGLREKDIITKINDTVLNDDNPLTAVIRKFNPNDQITLTIIRDGQEKTVKVELGERTE